MLPLLLQLGNQQKTITMKYLLPFLLLLFSIVSFGQNDTEILINEDDSKSRVYAICRIPQLINGKEQLIPSNPKEGMYLGKLK